MSNKKISLLFTGQSQQFRTSKAALAECIRLAETHNDIDHVFFYFDLVNIVKDKTMYEQWKDFKSQYSLALIACSTVATRRGIENNLTGPFELAGLSEFYSRLHNCQTLVQIQ